jgi:Fe2+ or Zn2+ uptake regulation protein
VYDEAGILREHGIKPSAHRVAVARYVLRTHDHPSADEVWTRVKRSFPLVSRGTVYNTLNLFVQKGLLRQYALTEGRVVFDPKVEAHHHFIDEKTGAIFDVPWDAVAVSDVERLARREGFEVSEYQVVIRGRRRGQARSSETKGESR